MRYLYVRLKNYFLYDMKLKNKFFCVYLICTALPFFALSMYICTSTSNRINAHIEENVSVLMTQTRKFINYRLDNIVENVNTIYLDTSIYNYLSFSGKIAGFNEELIESKLAILAEGKEIQNVNLYLVDREKIPEHNYRCLPISSAYATAWYRRLSEQDRSSVWMYSRDGYCIYYAKKIFSKYDKNQLVGYIVATINQSVVIDLIDVLCYTNDTCAFILDENGALVLTRGKRDETLEKEMADLSFEKTAGNDKFHQLSINEKNYCVAQAYLPNYNLDSIPNWYILMVSPYDELFASRKLLMQNMLFTELVSLIALILIASKIIGSITARMARLNENMKRVKTDGFVCSSVALGRDEISALQESFDYLIIRMDQMFEQTIKANERARENELNYLQSQINPHFLYNTLDLINWMAKKVGCDEISDTTFMLAKFYRLSLRKGVRIVRLSDELQHISLYVGLQNKRFENAINLHIDVPEKDGNCAVLKLMLQPIVENSVIHGIMEKESSQGNIWIRTERNIGDLIVVIEDDGEGIDENTLKRINSRCQNEMKSGIGVANTHRRIENCFGMGYGLRFETEKGVYTRVIIKIPFVEYMEKMSGMLQIKAAYEEM